MRNWKVLPITIILTVLTGCAIYEEPKKVYQESAAKLERAEKMRQEGPRYNNVKAMGRLYVEQITADEANRPEWYFQDTSIGFSKASFNAVLAQLFYDLPVNFKFLDGIDKKKGVSVSYSGPIGEALNAVANAAGYSYTLDGNTIIWSKFQTKTIDIAMFPGIEAFGIGKTGKSNQGEDDNGSGVNTQRSSVISSADEYAHTNGTVDVFNDLKTTLELMKSDEGSIQINQSTTTVVVRDYPSNVAKIEAYIAQQNERLTRQVMFEMEVIDVVLESETAMGLDWSIVGTDLAGHGIDIAAGSSLASSIVTGSAPFVVDLTKTTGQWAGSNALIQALESQGSVSVQTMPRTTVLNNRVAKLRNVNREYFIEERTVTNTLNVGTEGSIKQAQVETGFSLFLLPKVYKNDVVLRVTTNLSFLLGIERKGALEGSISGETDGGANVDVGTNVYVESPRVNDKDFDNSVIIPTGATLIIAGFSSEENQSEDQKAGVEIAGTAKTSKRARKETIIAITPRILRGVRG